LLKAAGEDFADVGRRAATIREVGAGANSGTALTYPFGDKVDLYTVCPFWNRHLNSGSYRNLFLFGRIPASIPDLKMEVQDE
jgi:hypothetical protein